MQRSKKPLKDVHNIIFFSRKLKKFKPQGESDLTKLLNQDVTEMYRAILEMSASSQAIMLIMGLSLSDISALKEK